jgi:chromosome segregation ATPase
MAKKVYIDFELKYKEAVANLDEMQKEYSKLEKEVAKTKDTQEELGGVLDKTTGGAITKFKGLKGTLGTVVKSFKTLRGAIIATGIGALIVAVGSLTAMFSRSEEGQNKFAKILTQLGVIAGNVMDIFSDLGKVVFNVFTGNFKAAGEALNEVTEGIKNFGEETRKEIEVAGELADMRAKADIEERKLITERAEANRRVAELREKAADKENVSVQERIEAIKEAGRIEEEITRKEIEAAKLRFEAKQLENSLAESTKEDLDEEARLKARLTELETGRLKIQKALTAEITTALREEEAERNRIDAERKAKEEAERKEKEELALEEKKRKELEAKEQESLDAARRKKLEDELAYQEYIEKAKIAVISQTFGTLANILGKNSKAGKAFAIAQALTNTYLGVTEVLDNETTLPEPFATIQRVTSIAGVLATGFQAVKSIKSVNPKGGSAATTISAGGVGQAAPQAPAFNIVGAGVTNQLADVIAGQASQPTRAYVVSNDVSTAQELDRNIIQGASIG